MTLFPINIQQINHVPPNEKMKRKICNTNTFLKDYYNPSNNFTNILSDYKIDVTQPNIVSMKHSEVMLERSSILRISPTDSLTKITS